MLITFSGLDGSGKSTLIDALRGELQARGRRVTVLTMYDHVGIYAAIRAMRDRMWALLGRTPQREPEVDKLLELEIQRSERGPVTRCAYAVVRSSAVRRAVLVLDVALFRLYRIWIERVRRRVLLMDRYFYDTLADIALERPRAPRRLPRLATRPDLSIFVDISPEEAFARKGEYPVDWARRRREVYLEIFQGAPGAVVLRNDDLTQTIECLAGHVWPALGIARR